MNRVEIQREAPRPRASADLLTFLMPGLVHGLGNALFTIHGHAELLGTGTAGPARGRDAILAAVAAARQRIEIMHLLTGPSVAGAHEQAGIVLNRLAEVLRVPLRDHHLVASVQHTSTETPRNVPTGPFVHGVAETVRLLVEAAPPGFQGSVVIDLVRQEAGEVTVHVFLDAEDGLLPFPAATPSVVSNLQRSLATAGVRAASEGPAGVRLVFRTDAGKA